MLKTIIRRWLFVIACVVTLVALFYAEEDWRGKHAWDTYKREREAKGDSFEWSSIVPPPVPDNENFATTPLFAELFPKPPHSPMLDAIRLPDCPQHPEQFTGNYRLGRADNLSMWPECFTNTDLLVALSKCDPILHEITEASRRPYCRFPIRYEDNFDVFLPHLHYMFALVRAYRLRASVKLSVGQSDAALADVQTSLRLADKLNGEPVLMSFLVRVAMLDITREPIWEALAAHRWNESQLAALQAQLEKVDQCASLAKMLQGERLCAYSMALWLHSHPTKIDQPFIRSRPTDLPYDEPETWLGRAIPSGWIDQNQLNFDRFCTETLLPALDWEHRRINPKKMEQVDHLSGTMRATPYRAFFRGLLPPMVVVAAKAALSQTRVDEAVVACALDRYWLAHGEFPENLDAITPQFIAKMPYDVINGEPLHYRRTADGQYVLYSVGWNQTDDGGQIAMNGVYQDFYQGDWVWFSQPQPQLSANERK